MLTDERIDANVDSHFMKLNNLTPHQWRSFARAIEAEATAPLLARIAEMEKELETERMRLAACGVVAMANTRESAEKARQMHPDYMSGSCKDVMRAVDAEMGYRERVAELEADAKRWKKLKSIAGFGIRRNGVIELSVCFSEYQPDHIGQLDTAIDETMKEQP
jgi:hypothetical protein